VSFIETSALDSTNVETAFKSLLTGSYLCIFSAILSQNLIFCRTVGLLRVQPKLKDVVFMPLPTTGVRVCVCL